MATATNEQTAALLAAGLAAALLLLLNKPAAPALQAQAQAVRQPCGTCPGGGR